MFYFTLFLTFTVLCCSSHCSSLSQCFICFLIDPHFYHFIISFRCLWLSQSYIFLHIVSHITILYSSCCCFSLSQSYIRLLIVSQFRILIFFICSCSPSCSPFPTSLRKRNSQHVHPPPATPPRLTRQMSARSVISPSEWRARVQAAPIKGMSGQFGIFKGPLLTVRYVRKTGSLGAAYSRYVR